MSLCKTLTINHKSTFCVSETQSLLETKQNSSTMVKHFKNAVISGARAHLLWKQKSLANYTAPNVKVGRGVYHSLLRRCTHYRNLREARLAHARVLDSEFKDDIVMLNCVIHMYARCGGLEDARRVFDEMPSKDGVTWTILISGYCQLGRDKDCLFLFIMMLRAGLLPNEFTLSSVLKASAVGSGRGLAGQLHAFCLKLGNDLNVYVGTALLDVYARCGNMEEAHLIFDGMRRRNEVSWNALIGGHARKGDGEQAFQLFSNMLKENLEPTQFTYSNVLGSCASMGSLEQGKWVHARIVKSGAKLVAFVGHRLLDMYGKSGSIEDAKKVFDRLLKRDVVSWNSMLTAYAQHGFGKIALQKFEEMLRLGVAPNGITFLCVLTACSHSRLLNEGLSYFNQMKKCNVKPLISHYVTIIDLLGRAGLLNRAEKFIREMPIEPTAAVWGALLGACRMHKNMELGAYAAERIIELDPHDSGPHMLLYNIYACAGRWNDAAKVRKMMKDSRVKKKPAYSWVEIENKVHTFVADDDGHPQREEINQMWEKLSEKIKGIGYVPDTSHVLLFVDQQEREEKLQYHSEKLALAFALLNTSPGSTIRIKKNIRVCGDCHTAFKLASKVEDREIIVRDTNRFHHFHKGFCSCGDYW